MSRLEKSVTEAWRTAVVRRGPTLHVPVRQLLYWSTNRQEWVVARGKRIVSVGSSSRDLRLEQSID